MVGVNEQAAVLYTLALPNAKYLGYGLSGRVRHCSSPTADSGRLVCMQIEIRAEVRL